MVTELSPFYDFNRNFGRMLDNFFTPGTFSQWRETYPPLNISEDAENIFVQCEIPGSEIEDIEITLSDSSLVIKGQRKADEGKYYRQERAQGVFQRVVTLNAPVNRKAIKASLKNGILDIILPKSAEAKPKKITIEAI